MDYIALKSKLLDWVRENTRDPHFELTIRTLPKGGFYVKKRRIIEQEHVRGGR